MAPGDAGQPRPAFPLRLLFVGLTTGEVVYLQSAVRRVDPTVTYELCLVDRVAEAVFDRGPVYAIVFSTASVSRLGREDVSALQTCLATQPARAFVIASPDSPARSIPAELQPLIHSTPDLSAPSVANAIVRFHRESNDVIILLGKSLFALLTGISYLAALGLVANYFHVRSGGESWLEAYASWRAEEVVTFFGAFFVMHCLVSLVRSYAGARDSGTGEFDLARLVSRTVSVVAGGVVGIAIYWENLPTMLLVSNVVGAVLIHAMFLGATRFWSRA